MKPAAILFLTAVICLAQLGSCTIQKRVHRKGWHVEWRKHYSSERNTTEIPVDSLTATNPIKASIVDNSIKNNRSGGRQNTLSEASNVIEKRASSVKKVAVTSPTPPIKTIPTKTVVSKDRNQQLSEVPTEKAEKRYKIAIAVLILLIIVSFILILFLLSTASISIVLAPESILNVFLVTLLILLYFALLITLLANAIMNLNAIKRMRTLKNTKNQPEISGSKNQETSSSEPNVASPRSPSNDVTPISPTVNKKMDKKNGVLLVGFLVLFAVLALFVFKQ